MWYSSLGQQEIISSGPVPTIGSRSPEFGGYTDAVVYRPLIANSQQYFADPDRWKPSTTSHALTTALQQAFRSKFPKLCRLSGAEHNTLEPLPYRNEEVKIVKAYTSASGRIVARLHLEGVDCADVEAGFDIDDPWFVVDTKKSITYLDSGLWLVDAGDYDNDGRSELVFSINRGVSILLCKRPGFVFGDGSAREGAAPLPSPSHVEGFCALMMRFSPGPAFVPATES